MRKKRVERRKNTVPREIRPAAENADAGRKPRKNNTNQTFRRRCRNQVLRFTLSVVLSPLFAFFISSEQECTRAVKTHTKAQTRREDSEPCFLNRAFARLQRRDDLSPLSATTQGSRTSALGRLRFELTKHSRDWVTFTSYNKTIKTTEKDR